MEEEDDDDDDDLSCYNNNKNNNYINNNSKIQRKNEIESRTTSLELCNILLRNPKKSRQNLMKVRISPLFGLSY